MHRSIAAALVLGMASLSFAATLEVPGDYATIQSAVDAAVDGDIVNVASGTYAEQVLIVGKAIELRGDESGTTTLDGSSFSGSILQVSNVNKGTAVVRDLECINGTAVVGGGIYGYYSNLDVHDCSFFDNAAENWGGGLNLYECTSTITGCHFQGNSTTMWYDGGGMAARQSSFTINSCTFIDNTAVGQGGGMLFMASDVDISDCNFYNNHAGNGGGGMCASGVDSSGTIDNCVFEYNDTGNYASALQCSGFTGSFSNCQFMYGTSSFGGGVMVLGLSYPVFTNCTFHGNTNGVGLGGGITMSYNGHASFIDCTISSNTSAYGGGVWAYQAAALLDNCEIVGNTSWDYCGGLGFAGPPGYNATVINCYIHGNVANGGGGGLYNIGTSPPNVWSTTICGNTPDQVFGNWHDLGDNYIDANCPDCFEDIDGNGAVDVLDLLAVISQWGSCPGCPEDFDGNGVVDIMDLLAVLDNWGSCP